MTQEAAAYKSSGLLRKTRPILNETLAYIYVRPSRERRSFCRVLFLFIYSHRARRFPRRSGRREDYTRFLHRSGPCRGLNHDARRDTGTCDWSEKIENELFVPPGTAPPRASWWGFLDNEQDMRRRRFSELSFAKSLNHRCAKFIIVHIHIQNAAS